MVKRFSIQELARKTNNIYALVRTLATRAVDLNRGAQPLLLKPKSKNSTTIALEEMMAGKLNIKTQVFPEQNEEN